MNCVGFSPWRSVKVSMNRVGGSQKNTHCLFPHVSDRMDITYISFQMFHVTTSFR